MGRASRRKKRRRKDASAKNKPISVYSIHPSELTGSTLTADNFNEIRQLLGLNPIEQPAK